MIRMAKQSDLSFREEKAEILSQNRAKRTAANADPLLYSVLCPWHKTDATK